MHEKSDFFMEKFWWFRKKSYLCTRKSGTPPDKQDRKEFFERFT